MQLGGADQQPQRWNVLGDSPSVFRVVRAARDPLGVIKAIYPATWGIPQLDGPLSDRWGRKWLIAGGMAVQAVGIWLAVLVPQYGWWIVGAALQGLGTAMVYPVLLAAIGNVAHPKWRATSMEVYRLWRDLGYAIGALLVCLEEQAGIETQSSVSRAMAAPFAGSLKAPSNRSGRRFVISRVLACADLCMLVSPWGGIFP